MRFLRPIYFTCGEGCTSGGGNCGCNDPITLVTTVAGTAGEDGADGTDGNDGAIVVFSDTTGITQSAIGVNKIDFTAATTDRLTQNGDRWRISGVYRATNIPGVTADYLEFFIDSNKIFSYAVPTVDSGKYADIYVECYVNRVAENAANNTYCVAKIMFAPSAVNDNTVSISTSGNCYRTFQTNFASASNTIRLYIDKKQATGTLSASYFCVEKLKLKV